jgi:hypothetical protein
MRLLGGISQWKNIDFHNFLRVLCHFCRFLPDFARIQGLWRAFKGLDGPRLRRRSSG